MMPISRIPDTQVFTDHVNRVLEIYGLHPRFAHFTWHQLVHVLHTIRDSIQPDSLAETLYCYASLEDLRAANACPAALQPTLTELESWGLSVEGWFGQFDAAYLALVGDLIGHWLLQKHFEMLLRADQASDKQPEVETYIIH